LVLFQNLVCRQKIWYSVPFRGGVATIIQMLDDGEVFNFEVERQQLRRCQNMEKHKHSTCTGKSKCKATEFCAVGSFLYSQIQLPWILVQSLAFALHPQLSYFSSPSLIFLQMLS
jgi:hypothetical protein